MDAIDYQLIEAIQNGLPISSRPYAEIGEALNLTEQEVIDRLTRLRQRGLVKRLGVIVNHRQLGYRANAMIVMNVPDHLVDQIGNHISQFSFISLCYQRPRQDERWPYNLYCMIHGKSKERVLEQLEQLLEACGLAHYPREVLFSRRCFKQRGAVYNPTAIREMEVSHG